jgi:hypothetical protein
MTGAVIVRWEAGDAVVLAVHGCFDGAAAWSLRLEMEGSPARELVVDLTNAEEAYDFAAGILASWIRQRARDKRVVFRAGSSEQARILAGHGLEVLDEAPPWSAARSARPEPVLEGTGAV